MKHCTVSATAELLVVLQFYYNLYLSNGLTY